MKKLKFKWDQDAIEKLYILTIIDGWSLHYALSFFPGGRELYRREVKRNQLLSDLVKYIKLVKLHKKGFYCNTRY